MPIRRIFRHPPAQKQTQAKKYFVSYCVMDGGLGFGHACLVLSEYNPNDPNANVRVNSAYGFYSLAKTVASKIFGFDPVSVGQIKKEDLRYFVMPDANYVYNFEITEKQMNELKNKLETRMKLYNELIPDAKKRMKAQGSKGKISDTQALKYIKDNLEEFPELNKLKPSDFKGYHAIKNNCVLQAQAMLSDIGLHCKDALYKATQQKFLSKKATKTKEMQKVNMASIGGTSKSYFEPFSAFSFNPIKLIGNLVSKFKGTLPKGQLVEYKKWQTTSKDIESAKVQYTKKEYPDLFAMGNKLLKKYKALSLEELQDKISTSNQKGKEQDLKHANEVVQKWNGIDRNELIKKQFLHTEAEAFWTQRFQYVDDKGQQHDLSSNLSQNQVKLIAEYHTLIKTLKERLQKIIPDAKENEMLMSFLDAAYVALSQVSMDYQKIENILHHVLHYHEDILKDELKQELFTPEEKATLKRDLIKLKDLSKNETHKANIKKNW